MNVGEDPLGDTGDVRVRAEYWLMFRARDGKPCRWMAFSSRDLTHEIVAVTPGSYEFTHHTGERAFNRDAPGTVIYAHARRVTS